MERKSILEAVKKLRESEKRNFKQTFDLAINLKNIDLKKPENRIKTEVYLPNGTGKKPKIGIFADALIPNIKHLADESVILIRKDEIENFQRNKKKSKNIAKTCYAFLAEAQLMPLVGKSLGPVLAPRNKMPKPIPPTVPDLKPIIERARNTIKINLKDSPVIHCGIGLEDMDDNAIAENMEAILKTITPILPKGKEQIKNVYLKLTMSKPIKIE